MHRHHVEVVHACLNGRVTIGHHVRFGFRALDNGNPERALWIVHGTNDQHLAAFELFGPVSRMQLHQCHFLVGHVLGERRPRWHKPHVELLRSRLRRRWSPCRSLCMHHHRSAQHRYRQGCAHEPRAKSRADHGQHSTSVFIGRESRPSYHLLVPDQSIAADFLAFSVKKMNDLHHDIAACLGKLSEEQIWRRGGPHENSIGNLLLHLEGNLRQWILHGIAGQPDVRRRDDEFTLTPTVDSKTAFASFAATLSEARDVIGSRPQERLTETIDPQPASTWRHTPILVAIYKVVGHLEYHTGQII